jgi:uncharacterized protein (DUF1501 family)
MSVTRRQFIHGGVAAFTVTFAAPEFLSDLARAQGSRARNLVVLYLSGGNDSLSMVIPYNDSFYRSRRPTLAVPAANVLQIGTDSSRVAIGLHPRLTGLKQIFDQGRLALIQRTGYPNQSRSHFQGTDIWSTANPADSTGLGWVGRYLDSLPSPVDSLVGWNTTSTLPHVLQAAHVAVPAIPNPATYAFNSPNTGTEARAERTAAARMASHVPINQPELAFVYGSAQEALGTLDRVATVGTYTGTAAYPANNGFAQALKAVAGAMVRSIGTKIFYVTTGGFDNHSGQSVNAANGTYFTLMATLNDGLFAFYTDLANQGLLDDTLVLSFSEFGRRISENGSNGTDHGAASVMLALGGNVKGGLYGTAPSLNPDPANPTLENGGADVTFQTDFRSVYAQVIDQWLGADSRAILGGDFRAASLTFI